MSGGGEGFSLFLDLGESKFDLEKAVCNHGFFMMAPNCWVPSSKTLQRPLRLADSSKSVKVSIFKSYISNYKNSLVLRIHNVNPNNISKTDEFVIKQQVRRMLRISQKDEDMVKEYHKKILQLNENNKDNEDRYKPGSGRIFRSPSLFEDLVKCILLCNTKWSKSLRMAQALCELQIKPSSNSSIRSNGLQRSREESNIQPSNGERILGNFPIPEELSRLDEKTFKDDTNHILGYRATYILRLAKDVVNGKIRLDEFEKLKDKDDMLHQFMQIKGFGSFASANAMMCVGYYHKVPADTETVRHLKEVHGRKNCNKNTCTKDAEEIYNKYAPFQCLAYWSELLDSYESKFGKLSELPNSEYHTISGRLKHLEKGS